MCLVKVVWESVGSVFKKGMKLEVVDKMRISQVRVATVVDITGRRLQLAYDDSEGSESDGFWCHDESPLIHPVGWARKVGHQIAATPDYHDRYFSGLVVLVNIMNFIPGV